MEHMEQGLFQENLSPLRIRFSGAPMTSTRQLANRIRRSGPCRKAGWRRHQAAMDRAI